MYLLVWNLLKILLPSNSIYDYNVIDFFKSNSILLKHSGGNNASSELAE